MRSMSPLQTCWSHTFLELAMTVCMALKYVSFTIYAHIWPSVFTGLGASRRYRLGVCLAHRLAQIHGHWRFILGFLVLPLRGSVIAVTQTSVTTGSTIPHVPRHRGAAIS